MKVLLRRPGWLKGGSSSGFTLIELLIVVAIIAILAAIAVPNFLEAQTRAKVSRVKADMRTLATAIESYTIDYNRPPLGFAELLNGAPSPYTKGWTSILGQSPFIHDWSMLWAYRSMTTPVAFVTSVPQDPFYVSEFLTRSTVASDFRIRAFYQFDYVNFRVSSPAGAWQGEPNSKWRRTYEFGHSWGLTGVGPGKIARENPPYMRTVMADATGVRVVGTQVNVGGNLPGVDGIYDPSNGTISTGRLFRTNKGIITQGGS